MAEEEAIAPLKKTALARGRWKLEVLCVRMLRANMCAACVALAEAKRSDIRHT